jgi:hypothetical protein
MRLRVLPSALQREEEEKKVVVEEEEGKMTVEKMIKVIQRDPGDNQIQPKASFFSCDLTKMLSNSIPYSIHFLVKTAQILLFLKTCLTLSA